MGAALHEAVQRGRPTILGFLLGRDKGWNISKVDREVALIIAACTGQNSYILALIESGVSVHVTEPQEPKTALHKAIEAKETKRRKPVSARADKSVPSAGRIARWTILPAGGAFYC